MTKCNTGIVCSCDGCGHRWPLLVEAPDKPDKDLFWPLVFAALEELVCPRCGSTRWAATMRFVEPKKAAEHRP